MKDFQEQFPKLCWFWKFLKTQGDKALFGLALVFAIAFLAVALFCGENPWQQIEKTPEITFTQWWEDDLGRDTLMALAEEFEELHGIKVNLNYSPYEDILGTLLLSAERLPLGDVVAIDPLWLPELHELKIIEGNFNLLSFIDVLYYNVEILKDSDFTRPPKNRSEFLEYARAVTAKGAAYSLPGPRYALVMAPGESRGIYDDVFPWIWAAGVPLIKDGSPVVNSRQVVESLAFLAALNGEGLIGPNLFGMDMGQVIKDDLPRNAAAKLEAFVSGRAAFMVAPTVYIAKVRERMGDEAFGVTSVPAPDNYFGRPFLATAGWAFGIHSASPRKEEARLFAEFLAGKAAAFSERTGAFGPGNGSPNLFGTNSFETPSRDPFYSKVWDIAISGESARDFAGLPWTELEAVFREGLISLFTGKTSPAETAAEIQDKLKEKREE